MNKGYAFGFLLVLLVVVLGFYVAYTGFTASREISRFQARTGDTTDDEQAMTSPTTLPPTLVATPPFSLTLVPQATITPTITSTITSIMTMTLTVEVAETSAPTQPPANAPASSPTAPPSPSTATVGVPEEPDGTAPPSDQPPTPVSDPARQFRLAGPPAADPSYSICCYIFGTVRDAAGNGLEGVQVQASNEWTPAIVAVTKGGGEIGKYDIPINASIQNWDIALIDAAGTQISSEVRIQFDANVASGYRVDWQRTY
jgi:hypothetical protein